MQKKCLLLFNNSIICKILSFNKPFLHGVYLPKKKKNLKQILNLLVNFKSLTFNFKRKLISKTKRVFTTTTSIPYCTQGLGFCSHIRKISKA